MSWKDWPKWIQNGYKGIMIGLAVFVISLIVIGIEMGLHLGCSGDVCSGTILSKIFFPIFSILIWPVGFFRSLDVHYGFQILFYNLLAIVLPFIQLFIIGALTGLVIGKIKSKKK
jgi:hypothetical protein